MPDWRIEKARQFLEDAQRASSEGAYDTCISRAYYAAYHLAAAVLGERANQIRDRWDHQALLGALRTHFCYKSFLLSRRDGDTFDDLMKARFQADYENAQFGEKRARELLQKATSLCDRIREVLGGEKG